MYTNNMMMDATSKICLPGGAGLVGQNLLIQLRSHGYSNITVIDKHKANIQILKTIHPEITIIEADLAESGRWESAVSDADVVVMLQAQIGAKHEEPFIRNNIVSTKNILSVMEKCNEAPYLIHISSSVLESVASDYYTNTKKAQEILVKECSLKHVILRPTLMFGWFDRKHLGWLSRFMKKVPVFPIPGHGNYMRQPLYVNDFCGIIISCIERRPDAITYNISGHERVNYIDIIREIKQAVSSKAIIIRIPYALFYVLLKLWCLFDRNPPFTTNQLEALVTPDEFETINWPEIFSVKSTPFCDAIHETFCHPEYSKYELRF